MTYTKTLTIQSDKINKSTAVLTLIGDLDTAGAPLLERNIERWGDEISELVLDFSELRYISSMGLRVLLQAYKTMHGKNQRLVIKNLNEAVREVFEMTSFINFIVHEEKFVVIRKDEPEGTVLFFNGDMKIDNIPAILQELQTIKEQNIKRTDGDGPVTVILDMEKLNNISAGAIYSINETINETAWKNRIIIFRNVNSKIKAALKTVDIDI